MRWVALYPQKIIALHSLAKHAETTPAALCEAYSDAKTPNGLLKADIFKSALTGNYTAKQVIHINEVCNLPHNKDNRTPLQYATDLIIGWLSEDAIIKMLPQAELIGADKTRDFLTKETISHSADINTPNGKIELIFDYTNHWSKANKLDLRDNKLDYLKQNNITLLGIAPRTGKAIIINDYNNFTHGEIPAYNKTGWTLHNVTQHLEPINEAIAKLQARSAQRKN
jgi:hypothetical protein